jgi:LytTr DNA-binding domain-containing protein
VPAGGHSRASKLGAAEASLDPARFVWIHRSYLLNIGRIACVELYAKDSRVAMTARWHPPRGEPRRLRALGEAAFSQGALTPIAGYF